MCNVQMEGVALLYLVGAERGPRRRLGHRRAPGRAAGPPASVARAACRPASAAVVRHHRKRTTAAAAAAAAYLVDYLLRLLAVVHGRGCRGLCDCAASVGNALGALHLLGVGGSMGA